MRKLYPILFLCLIITFGACKRKELVGPQGPAGQTGPAGTSGLDALAKQGVVEGTLTGNTRNGEPFSETFKYEYHASLQESRFYKDHDSQENEYYNIFFKRRSLTDTSDYMSFRMSFPANEIPAADDIQIDLNFEKQLADGKYLYFTAYNMGTKVTEEVYFYNSESGHNLEISNYQFDPATGALKFNFKIDYYENLNTSGNPATATGKVDIILKEEVR